MLGVSNCLTRAARSKRLCVRSERCKAKFSVDRVNSCAVSIALEIVPCLCHYGRIASIVGCIHQELEITQFHLCVDKQTSS